MSEDQQASAFVPPTITLDDLIAAADQPVKPGQIVTVKITSLGDGEANVVVSDHPDLQGLLRLDVPNEPDLSVGDTLSAYVEDRDGEGLKLSLHKARRLSLWADLQGAYQSGEPIPARGLAVIRGGLSVDIGLKATLPARQTLRAPGQSLEDLIGERFEVWITRLDGRRGQIQVSQREKGSKPSAASADNTQSPNAQAPNAQAPDAQAPEGQGADAVALEAPAEGSLITGTVARLVEFGAFIELGGYEGLLHVNDMSWGRTQHPGEVVQPGDQIELKVMSVKAFDQPKKRRVKLSLKDTAPDPWTTITAEDYPAEQRLQGKVISMTDFGAFLEVAPGVEGMVHVSEMSWTGHIKHPRDRLSVGEAVDVKVLQCDPARRRLSLSMKLAEHNPWHGVSDRYPVGTRIRGKVARITRFGLFIALEEGIDGLVHSRDLSWVPGAVDPQKAYSAGDEVEALILNVDEEAGKVALGIKQLTPDDSAEIYSRFTPGQQAEGKVTNVREFGIFVALAPGIEGLLHRTELGEGGEHRPRDHFKKGQRLSVQILSVDPAAGRVSLTLKGTEAALPAPAAETATAAPAEAPAAEAIPEKSTAEAPAEAPAAPAAETPSETPDEPSSN